MDVWPELIVEGDLAPTPRFPLAELKTTYTISGVQTLMEAVTHHSSFREMSVRDNYNIFDFLQSAFLCWEDELASAIRGISRVLTG